MLNNFKAYAKVNIFLKITGKRGNYHEIVSRFMLVKNLYDEIGFVKKKAKSSSFEIDGVFTCSVEQNSIYGAYLALLDSLEVSKKELLVDFMQRHVVKVEKKIPAFAGLGGGSSDAATYLNACNKILNLGMQTDELAKIGSKVGADVAFFIYGYESANVSGVGEIVEKFDEDALELEIFTPKIEISTPVVYKSYRENFYNPCSEIVAENLKKSSSVFILDNFDALEANDLFAPALKEYKELGNFADSSYHFSGSGSSFFKRSLSHG